LLAEPPPHQAHDYQKDDAHFYGGWERNDKMI
jgi:hypothetical protein